MSAGTDVDLAAVRQAVEDVADPELPPVTLGMLGMVHDVRVASDGSVTVELLPTFSGCPATDLIVEDVQTAARAVTGVTDVSVQLRHDPPWTPDRIDEAGREALRRFGIAPPGGPLPGAVQPDGRPSLPLTVAADPFPRPCPYCGSDDTVRDAPFGPTPCRDVRYCRACDQPFEAFKS